MSPLFLLRVEFKLGGAMSLLFSFKANAIQAYNSRLREKGILKMEMIEFKVPGQPGETILSYEKGE